MIGDPGPYVSLNDCDIWVPRTVPYLEARRIAREAIQDDSRLVYIGKTEATLLGFSRACLCEEMCHFEIEDRDDYDPAARDTCRVPAWHFRQEES